jgi:UDP-N-acetylmuramoyl-tripeptide--D-alanyl-D-alanine ligase
MSAGRLAELTGGALVQGSADTTFAGIAIDSREVFAGCAFVAFPGERVDAAEFVPAAVRDGARVAVVTRFDEVLSKALEGTGAAIVVVADASDAVRLLAAHTRSQLRCDVVGITGSTGKTTTKDFLASVLAIRLQVVATEGNRNNELGVPLTVLEAGADTDVLVIEMGMRGRGQIEALCEIARPTIGLVTNIGQTHIELLGSQGAIVEAKAELVACVPATGAVFLNGDDELSRSLSSRSHAPVTFYGMSEDVSVRAEVLDVDEGGRPLVRLAAGGRSVEARLPLPGRHNAYTAAAAAAVALHLGLDLGEVCQGLEHAKTTGMRMEVFAVASGVTLINDAYNANPTSMRAAINALTDIETAGRRVAVLGDMAELGSLSELAHFRLGEQVAVSGIDRLVTVGERARRIAEGARAAGMPPEAVLACLTTNEATSVLDDMLAPDDTVLVKASRSMNLERVVEGIVRPNA